MSSYLSDIDLERVPTHVGIVMDGNGRWATQRGLPRTEGHAAGEEAMFDTVKGGVEVGLRWLTMFAFSTENWNRPQAEVRYLMELNFFAPLSLTQLVVRELAKGPGVLLLAGRFEGIDQRVIEAYLGSRRRAA